jgi:hypothetical protein
MSILNVNKINPVGGGSTITIAGIASVTNNLTATNISAGSSVTANSFHGDGSQLSNITSTTINNNADNRIITGSGTANRLEGESNLTFNGTNLLSVHVPSATGEPAINFTNSDTGTGTSNGFGIGISGAESPYIYNRENTDIRIGVNNTERVRITKEGYITNPARPCFDVAKDNGAVSSTNAIVFNVVNVNNGSHYDTSNGRFTAPVTGTYFLYYGGIKNNTNSVVRIKLLKNGTGNYMNADRELRMDDGDAFGENGSMNVIVSLTATDYVQVYVTAGTIYGTDASYTHFGGYLLS